MRWLSRTAHTVVVGAVVVVVVYYSVQGQLLLSSPAGGEAVIDRPRYSLFLAAVSIENPRPP